MPSPSLRPSGAIPFQPCRAGGALGTTVLILALVALVAFIALTLRSEPADTPRNPVPQEAAPTSVGAAVAPARPVSTDPDEPEGVPSYPQPVLAFVERSDGLPTSGTWLGYPTLVDLDGDSRADVVASNREEDGVATWRFRAEGAWERHIEGLPRDMSYGPTAAADIDSDGLVDILIGDHVLALRAFLNDGKMNWHESAMQWPRPNLLKDLETADLDGDGFPDVVGVCHFKGGINVYLGDGRGGFRFLPQSENLVDARVFGREVEIADIDHDGTSDFAVTTDKGLKAFLTRPGDPLAWEEVSTGLPAPAIGNSLFGLDSGEFDAAPGAELVVCMVPDPGVSTPQPNAIGVFAFEAASRGWKQIDGGLPRSDSYKDVRCADFDGDGNTDILVASIESGRVIYTGDGRGGFTPRGRLPGHGKCRLTVGDIDADGLPDVLVATSGQKGIKVPGKLRAFLNHRDLWPSR